MKRIMLLALVLTFSFMAQPARADWIPAKRLTWNSGTSVAPAIAIDSSNTIHVVWYDGTPGNDEIFHLKSSDGGANWSPPKRLTWTSGNSQFPAIAIDSSDALHVVWQDDTPGNQEIYYKESADGGATWSPAKRLTWTSGASRGPALGVDSSHTLHVVWQDNTSGNYEVYHKSRPGEGTTWSPTKRLTWTLSVSALPDIAIDSGDSIHVVWHDSPSGNQEIYFKSSTDKGMTWSSAKRLTWTSGASSQNAICGYSDTVIHVVWNDDTSGNTEIYHKRSTDGGATWSPAKRRTWTSGGSYGPDLAIDSTQAIQVVWHDNTAGNYEMYNMGSTDGGLTWGTAQRITWTSGDSAWGSIAIDSSHTIHVVWYDGTPGDTEIYYKNGN